MDSKCTKITLATLLFSLEVFCNCEITSEYSFKGLSCRSRCWQIESCLCQTDKRRSASFQLSSAGFFGSRSKLENPGVPQYHFEHVKNTSLPFTHWVSVKAAWCCQPGCVAQCIPPDSFKSYRY